MPGIYGLVATKITKTIDIEKMKCAMMLYDHFISNDIYDDKIVSGGKLHLDSTKHSSVSPEEQSVIVWVEGEAYNLKELASVFNFDSRISLDKVLHLMFDRGTLNEFLNKLDGYFCAAIYDKVSGVVKLISDRYGMRMLYWHFNNGLFTWASEVKGMLALDEVDKELDPTSYECFMELGYLLGERTWFENIKLISPATILTFDIKKKELNSEYYWSWSEIKPSKIRFEDAVELVGIKFIEAVRKRIDIDGKVGIALSGGLDSRAIFAAVKHLEPEYRGSAYTFGVEGCDDISVAEQVIKKPNGEPWKYRKFYFNEKNWFEPRFDMIWNTDGMQDMMHMHGGEFLDNISELMDYNLNGYCGDVILGGGFLNGIPLDQRATEDAVRPFFKKFASLININDEFYDVGKVEPILLMNRVRRFTAMGTVNSLVKVGQRKPFFDNDLIELIYSLPDDYRKNNRLYSVMLLKFFPEYFESIPWQKTGEPVGLLKKSSIPKKVILRISLLVSRIFNIRSSEEYTDYSNWIKSEKVSTYLSDILDKNKACYSKLTDEDLGKKYLVPHLKNKTVNNKNEILRAATIEIYLRYVKHNI